MSAFDLLNGEALNQLRANTSTMTSTGYFDPSWLEGSELNVSTTRTRVDLSKNLTPKQVWIIQQIKKGRLSSLLGQEFRIITDERGIPLPKLYLGNLVNISGDGAEGSLMAFTLHLADDSIYNARLFQIEPTKDVKPTEPTKKEIQAALKAKEDLAMLEFFKVLKRKTPSQYKRITDQLRMFNTNVEYAKTQQEHYLKEEKMNETSVKRLELDLAKLKDDSLDMADLELLFKRLNKHAKIEGFYLASSSKIVVLTKPLYGVGKNDKEDKANLIGRFLFLLEINSPVLYAINLDYAALRNSRGEDFGVYFHPNISSTRICWGNNQTEINNMLSKMELYEVFDFMITFFSTWPHEEDSNPFIDFDRWAELKERVILSDPTINSYLTAVLLAPVAQSKIYDALIKEQQESVGLKRQDREIDKKRLSGIAETEEDDDDD